MIADSQLQLRGDGSIPLLGFGTWQLRGRQAYDAVLHALHVGYRHIDTATAYGNEREIARAIRDSGVPRGDIFITTKLPPDRAGRELSTIERSLADLDTDYVDLWLVHWPPRGMASPSTWREVVGVQKVGLARAVGVSNYSTEQIDELIADSGVTPAVNQIRWSPFLYDPVRVAQLQERGIVLEGYSPFKAARLGHPVLVEAARRHGVTSAQVVLRWHIQHEFVVIPKSAHRDRIESNADIFGFSLSPQEMADIDALGHR
jgi:2,5-diketo-D-gluconate reductase A